MRGRRRRAAGLLAAGLLLSSAVSGHAAAQASGDPSAPWPRLPDGRVLLEIKGHRLALDPAVREGEVVFAPVPQRGGERVSLREVVADPARARAAFVAAHSVWVELINSHNRPGRFLGRFDRRAVPDTRILRIGFYEDGKATQCASVPWSGDKTPERLCERFLPLAASPPRLDDNGFIVDRPEFVQGLGMTFYILPAAERLSPAGEPVFFACVELLGFCKNAVGHLVDGYVVRPGVRLLYQFGIHHHPKPTWRDVDAQFRMVVDDLLIADAPGPRP